MIRITRKVLLLIIHHEHEHYNHNHNHNHNQQHDLSFHELWLVDEAAQCTAEPGLLCPPTVFKNGIVKSISGRSTPLEAKRIAQEENGIGSTTHMNELFQTGTIYSFHSTTRSIITSCQHTSKKPVSSSSSLSSSILTNTTS